MVKVTIHNFENMIFNCFFFYLNNLNNNHYKYFKMVKSNGLLKLVHNALQMSLLKFIHFFNDINHAFRYTRIWSTLKALHFRSRYCCPYILTGDKAHKQVDHRKWSDQIQNLPTTRNQGLII